MEHRGRDVPIAIGQLGDKFALGTPTPVQLPHGKEEKKDVLCTSRCGGSDPYSPPCSMHVSVTVFSNDEWDRVP